MREKQNARGLGIKTRAKRANARKKAKARQTAFCFRARNVGFVLVLKNKKSFKFFRKSSMIEP